MSTRVRGEAAGPAEKRATSLGAVLSSRSSMVRLGLSCRAAIGSSSLEPGPSGAPVGPQVCLGMFRSGANKPNTLVVG
ncbi:hypothetical protein SVIOM74S_04379 [Streptomyces violarus]